MRRANLRTRASLASPCDRSDDTSVEKDCFIPTQIFPRASAYGERLWSNPSSGFYEAETRILEHRRRLVDRGVRADALQPGAKQIFKIHYKVDGEELF